MLMSLSNPRYPVYIISKGRWESRKTANALDKINVPFRIVVEPQEADKYSNVIGRERVLVLPFSNLNQGGIPARNWVFEHSKNEGHKRHWILDDNISGFRRLFKNKKVIVTNGTTFRAAEDFVDRYKNVRMAGFQYSGLVVCESSTAKGTVKTPFCANARVYSCILLDNACRHRWRGRYNEDTDLSLRILKDGECTILFYAFLCDKMATMKMKGGNTDDLYKQNSSFDGRLEMALHLQRQHPDVTKVVKKWGRFQHSVNYRPFKNNKLIKKPGLSIKKGVDNYGMKIRKQGNHE